MRDYGKVYTTFWSSPTVTALTDDGKLLALYLMTCIHSTICGAFRLPDGYAAEDLGWPLARVSKALGDLVAAGFVRRCESTRWVWISKHIKWNPPENPNQIKSAAKAALAVPDECSWKAAFMRDCGPLLGLDPPSRPDPSATVSEPLPNPSETVSEPFIDQKQKQKQKQEQNSPRKRVLSAEVPPKPEDVTDQTWGDWLALRKSKKAPVTPTVVAGARKEAAEAMMPLEDFLALWCARGSQGLQASWIKPNERQAVMPASAFKDCV